MTARDIAFHAGVFTLALILMIQSIAARWGKEMNGESAVYHLGAVLAALVGMLIP